MGKHVIEIVLASTISSLLYLLLLLFYDWDIDATTPMLIIVKSTSQKSGHTGPAHTLL